MSTAWWRRSSTSSAPRARADYHPARVAPARSLHSGAQTPSCKDLWNSFTARPSSACGARAPTAAGRWPSAATARSPWATSSSRASARKVRKLYHDKVLGLRRRHRGCLHALRALRGQAGEAPGPPGARGDRTHQGLAHRPRAAPAGGDARRRRPRVVPDHHRQRRRAGAGAGDHRHRLRRPRQAAAKALLDNTELGAKDIVKKSLEIAGQLCIYTNMNHTVEVLE